jgi:triosephosphate isomerase
MNPAKGALARKMFQTIDRESRKYNNVEIVVCPPLVYLESIGELVTKRSCVLGAQDAFWEHGGAYTGQVSPDMIFNTRARYVIVGHSERRELGETDEIVNKKIKSILTFPLIPIVCFGERKRDGNMQHVKELRNEIKKTLAGLSGEDLSRLVLVYEPVWAISTEGGRRATGEECREMIRLIRGMLVDMMGDKKEAEKIPVLFGGSVDEEDAKIYLTEGEADGLLVGHASLDPKQFAKIFRIANNYWSS